MSGGNSITKNTIFLYIRMLLVMGVSLYTSRVVLHALGVEDYGIYQAVGGIVGFLAFLNSALGTGTSRFLAYELGRGDLCKLKRTFSTLLTAHLLLAVIIVIISEIVGPWFIANKLNLPAQRMNAAVWCFHISIATTFFSLIMLPYNACVIAHEKMAFFAYVSIAEVILKLGIVYLLRVAPFDRLIFYALLLLVVQVLLLFVYIAYTMSRYDETRGGLQFDRAIFKPIVSFSGWNLLSNGSIALNSQGILLLLGVFFSPAVVTARSISIQVNSAINQFINNIRTAVTPAVVKQYASGNKTAAESLCVSSAKYAYFLMLTLCLPACLVTPFLLKIWLGVVPEYTVIFVRLIIIQCLFQAFDTSLYTALYAVGRLKENALLSPLLGFVQFPVIYLLFRAGCSPVVLSWSNLIVYVLLGLVVKPILVVKVAQYDWRNLYAMYKNCLMVTVAILPVTLGLYCVLDMSSWQANLILIIASLLVSLPCIYFIGLDQAMRNKVMSYMKTFLK